MTNPLILASVRTKLATDLSTFNPQQLIELCLLHEAEPQAYPEFPDALGQEIIRRFNRDNINSQSTDYALLKRYYHKIKDPLSAEKQLIISMHEYADKDIWLQTHRNAIQQALGDEATAHWICAPQQSAYLQSLLNNDHGLAYVAQSAVMVTALLAQSHATERLKARNNWANIWGRYPDAVRPLLQSSTWRAYLIAQNLITALGETEESARLLGQDETLKSELQRALNLNNLQAEQIPTLLTMIQAPTFATWLSQHHDFKKLMDHVHGRNFLWLAVKQRTFVEILFADTALQKWFWRDDSSRRRQFFKDPDCAQAFFTSLPILNQITQEDWWRTNIVGDSESRDAMQANRQRIYQTIKPHYVLRLQEFKTDTTSGTTVGGSTQWGYIFWTVGYQSNNSKVSSSAAVRHHNSQHITYCPDNAAIAPTALVQIDAVTFNYGQYIINSSYSNGQIAYEFWSIK